MAFRLPPRLQLFQPKLYACLVIDVVPEVIVQHVLFSLKSLEGLSVRLNLNFFVGRPFIRRGASALVDRYYAAESPIQRRWRR